MIQDFVELFKNIALRHKLVRTFKYQDKLLNNNKNNYGTFQVYLDTVSLHQLNITTNVFTSSFELYILSQADGTSGHTVADVQGLAFTIAVDILGYIEHNHDYDDILSLHDYSIITLDHYSDDASVGVKLSVVYEMPSPLNLCELDEHFNDEPYQEDEDKEIDVPTQEIGELEIHPIKLPKNRTC